MVIGSCSVALALAIAGEPPSSDDGIGLLATGGLLAGIGTALAAVPIGCVSQCDEAKSTFDVRRVVGPAAFVLSSPFLVVGMHRLRLARIDRELAADPRRRVKAPPRFALFGGVVMMLAGGALLGTAVVLSHSPVAPAARWIGGPTLVGGALLTGTATAQRRAYDRAVAIAPTLSRTSFGVSFASRF